VQDVSDSSWEVSSKTSFTASGNCIYIIADSVYHNGRRVLELSLYQWLHGLRGAHVGMLQLGDAFPIRGPLERWLAEQFLGRSPE